VAEELQQVDRCEVQLELSGGIVLHSHGLNGVV